jgi:hypothetical protein
VPLSNGLYRLFSGSLSSLDFDRSNEISIEQMSVYVCVCVCVFHNYEGEGQTEKIKDFSFLCLCFTIYICLLFSNKRCMYASPSSRWFHDADGERA